MGRPTALQPVPPALARWGGGVGSGLVRHVLSECLRTACGIAGAGMASGEPPGQKVSAVSVLLSRNCIRQLQSQESVCALMKLHVLVKKTTRQCSSRLPRMGAASLSGSQSIWQITWEVIVRANQTENEIDVVLPSNEQTHGSEGTALMGQGQRGHQPPPRTPGPKRPLASRWGAGRCGLPRHGQQPSQASRSDGPAKTRSRKGAPTRRAQRLRTAVAGRAWSYLPDGDVNLVAVSRLVCGRTGRMAKQALERRVCRSSQTV